jgi:hypothetical protein
MGHSFAPGDPVVYRMSKQSEHPGPRAENIMPSVHGETYAYTVDKYWRVREILPDGKLLLVTRRGKTHVCDATDFRLRKPGLLTRFLRRGRFPVPVEQQ